MENLCYDHNITVIGTFVHDTIITLDHQKIESIGGAYHTTAYLASLVAENTRINPVCYINKYYSKRIINDLSWFGKHISFDSLHLIDQPNTCVTLTYSSIEERNEVTTAPMPAVQMADLAKLNDTTLLLVNLITGNEINPECLKQLKDEKGVPLIYLDLHSLAQGIDEQGRRYYRPIPNWQKWIGAVDILQLNEHEAATVAAMEKKPTLKDFISLGKQLVNEYVKACHITLGSQGSLLFYRDGGTIYDKHIKTPHRFQIVDTIGSGDAFGAAFIAHFIGSHDYLSATCFANKHSRAQLYILGISDTPKVSDLYRTLFVILIFSRE